jgi:hypothetical protein
MVEGQALEPHVLLSAKARHCVFGYTILLNALAINLLPIFALLSVNFNCFANLAISYTNMRGWLQRAFCKAYNKISLSE